VVNGFGIFKLVIHVLVGSTHLKEQNDTKLGS